MIFKGVQRNQSNLTKLISFIQQTVDNCTKLSSLHCTTAKSFHFLILIIAKSLELSLTKWVAKTICWNVKSSKSLIQSVMFNMYIATTTCQKSDINLISPLYFGWYQFIIPSLGKASNHPKSALLLHLVKKSKKYFLSLGMLYNMWQVKQRYLP